MSRPSSPVQQLTESPATTTAPSEAATTAHDAQREIIERFGTSESIPPQQTSVSATSVHPPNITGQTVVSTPSQSRPTLALLTQQVPLTGTVGFATLPVEASSSARPVRRAKAHVASACINCKRAHLSCDIQRPCRRCVDAGKEDTCHDVQHKKRGRPRLREDSEAGPSSAPQPRGASVLQQTPTRPIASTRPRRAYSYRSHQSHGSEGSSYGLVTPHSATTQSYLPMTHPGPSNVESMFEVPMALLDLDLVILRANRAFHQAVAALGDLMYTRLTDVVTPVDGTTLVDMRNRLRGEREQREPSFLPPIMQTGQDLLANVRDADIDRLAHGYADATHTWVASSDSTGQHPLTARVRLARATTYFVVVTLLPSRTMPQYHQSVQSPSISSSVALQRQMEVYAGQPRYTFPSGESAQPHRYDLRAFVPPPATAYVRTGPTMQPYQSSMIPFQHDLTGQGSAFAPSFTPVQYHPHPPPPQYVDQTLPSQPLNITAASDGTSTSAGEGAIVLGSSAEEHGEGSQPRGSKRRRRMGIDEVLQ
ncbi:hypothetical protein AMS68_004867 [Peltaster fructicola]|uniref:Zn(2)-C6 fungal-type domain-containing protein n=1 Tax=Peltaster fructicola TaxID=286661 RepID=A0A6H0XY50_9PEZI|nr:hypothetical protein AMS68_004867 [Peltaster fructicola]